MNFENLQVKKIISHFIHQPDYEGTPIPAIISQELISLDALAKSLLTERLVKVLGSDSKSVEMQISDAQIGSCFDYINKALINNRSNFIEQSQNIANKLAIIQNSDRKYPSGLLIVIYATVTASNLDCIIVIKAEEQSAFQKILDVNTSSISLNMLNDLFLTPQSKLYKVGVFIKNSNENTVDSLDKIATTYTAILYDSNFTKDLKNAAKYFYSLFLGLSIPENDKIITQKFYEETRKFINNMQISSEKKIELQNALYTELKTNTSPTISTATFSENYLDEDEQDNYLSVMSDANIPDRSFTKDISLIENVLKLRRYHFSSGVKIISPSESDLVKIISTDEEISLIDRTQSTIICIKGILSEQ